MNLRRFFRAVSFVVFTLLLTVGLLEAGSVGLYRLVFEAPLSHRDIQNKLVPPTALKEESGDRSAPAQMFIRNHILHPYLGFVANPGTYAGDWEFSRNGQETTVNEFGFPGMSPLVKRQKDTLTVCLLGGSFALNFYLDSRDTLADELKKRPEFRGRTIHVVLMAMSGWKQPQQVLALSYLASLGAEYDVVVNLDGFNEVALPFSENMPAGVYPFFPRSWGTYVSNLQSDQDILRSAKLIRLRERARAQRRFFSSAAFRHSNFFLFLFQVLDDKTQSEIARITQKLVNGSHQARSFENSGPLAPRYSEEAGLFKDAALQWETSSRLMNAICHFMGASYLHLLQPNQYVPDSKPMGEEERAVAYYEGTDSGYKNGAEKGYPDLVNRGRALLADGIRFVDLTMFFQNTQEAVYQDNCCHVNKHGNDLIAAQMASDIAATHQIHE